MYLQDVLLPIHTKLPIIPGLLLRAQFWWYIICHIMCLRKKIPCYSEDGADLLWIISINKVNILNIDHPFVYNAYYLYHISWVYSLFWPSGINTNYKSCGGLINSIENLGAKAPYLLSVLDSSYSSIAWS